MMDHGLKKTFTQKKEKGYYHQNPIHTRGDFQGKQISRHIIKETNLKVSVSTMNNLLSVYW